jgi:glycosyltransferase 2 family protein
MKDRRITDPSLPMNPSRSPRRALLIKLALVAVAFSLFGWVLYQNRVKIAEVFHKPVDYRFFGVGVAIYLTALLLTFFRWQQLVKAQGMVFSYRDAARLGFIGNLWNLVIPGAVGGDVIKAAFLCKMQPDKKPRAVASMVLDRILGLLGLFLLASIAGAVYFKSGDPQVRLLIGLVWGALAAGLTGLAVIFSPGLYRPLNRLVHGRGKLETIVRELEGIGLAYRQNLGRVAAMLGLSTFIHGLFVLAFYSASSALFATMPTLAEHYLMVPLALFTTAVPLPFGALGLSEGISGKLFELVNQHEGAIAMMAFRILMYGSGIVSACFYLANLREVRSIAEEAPLMVGTAIDETVVDPTITTKEVAR